MSLIITDKALLELRSNGVGSDAYLRLAVKPGGCAGMSYDMVVDDKMNMGDRVIYKKEGLQVIADPESVPYLDGLKIDFSDDLIETGFRLSNPKAQNACGCGSSFSCH
jgi:iron-sulfur cluster assembly accessory protein